jgi:hypothetical protein
LFFTFWFDIFEQNLFSDNIHDNRVILKKFIVFPDERVQTVFSVKIQKFHFIFQSLAHFEPRPLHQRQHEPVGQDTNPGLENY